jgi:fumarate hydratase subunit beta
MILNNINNKNLSLFKELKANTWITYTGNILVFRDQAHDLIKQTVDLNKKLAFSLKNKIILYAGPSNSLQPVLGPTTSKRMDEYLDLTLKQGVIATIGKGPRNKFVNNIIKQYKAPYLVLYSGVAAYLSSYFSNEKIIYYKELGPEAIREYFVKNLPLLLAIDADGNSFYN